VVECVKTIFASSSFLVASLSEWLASGNRRWEATREGGKEEGRSLGRDGVRKKTRFAGVDPTVEGVNRLDGSAAVDEFSTFKDGGQRRSNQNDARVSRKESEREGGREGGKRKGDEIEGGRCDVEFDADTQISSVDALLIVVEGMREITCPPTHTSAGTNAKQNFTLKLYIDTCHTQYFSPLPLQIFFQTFKG